MKTIQQDLRSNNLSLDEAITVAQNCPLWRLMSAFWRYTPLVVLATQEEEDVVISIQMWRLPLFSICLPSLLED